MTWQLFKRKDDPAVLYRHLVTVCGKTKKLSDPLDRAISGADARVIALVDHGANVNFKGSFGVRSLHLAIKTQHFDLVQWLLQAGADPNANEEKLGLTPLHFACDNDSQIIVETLLKYGANISQQDFEGNFPINFCARNGNWMFQRGILTCLLQRNTNVNAQNTAGQTITMLAARNSHCAGGFRRQSRDPACSLGPTR